MAEHMLQFGVWIDDDAIQKHIEESITNRALEEAAAMEKAANKYFKEKKSSWSTISRIDELAENAISREAKAYIDEHSKEIIDTVVSKLTSSVVNTKVFKEAVQEKVLTIPVDELVKLGAGGEI